MIITNNENEIYMAWRNEDGERQTKTVTTQPYFFVKETYKEETNYKIGALTRPYLYEYGEWYSLDGVKLKKVHYDRPSDLHMAKKHFIHPRLGDITYEADVALHCRYTVDNLDSLPEYDMKKWYWDMEWQQGGEHDGAITTIVVYDNYDKKFYQWYWFPNDLQHSYVPSLNCVTIESDTEKEMIENFLATIVDKDPDMLLAWFGLKFDLPKLIERSLANDLDPRVISPLGIIDKVEVKKSKLVFTQKDGYGATKQPIKGRLCLNLDLAFERQWNDAQRGTLPSLSLDYVSNTLFGEGKKMDTKFEDPNEFYRKGWLEDTEAYLEYGLIDVELLRRIDEENYTSEAILSLQKLLVAPFDYCFFASYMGGVYFMRNASWKAPTGSRPKHKVCDSCNHKNDNDKTLKICVRCGESLSYSGAMIYNPLDEGTNGLHHNVAAFDFAGLYPSMIIARNISFETKSKEVTVFGADLNTPQDLQPLAKDYVSDMLYYNTDELGLLPKSLISLKELRNEYKANLKEARKADDKLEVAKWNNNQMAVKRLMASFYGILAFKGFGWADVDLAASITASAREAIRLAAFKARGME